MFLFVVKSILSFLLIYFTFGFYGNVSDHLFIKCFFCVCILLAAYWVDIYRFSRIFLNYFRAVRCYKKGRYHKAFRLFEDLLSSEFAPSLPYLAEMKFTGLGTNINVNAAKYFSERAIRNDFRECLYLLAVINFFGETLNGYFTEFNRGANERDKTALAGGDETAKAVPEDNPNTKKRRTEVRLADLTPDYGECVFHLRQYLESASEKDRNYGEACALLAYCLYTGRGVQKNVGQSNDMFRHANSLRSRNAGHLYDCAVADADVDNYLL